MPLSIKVNLRVTGHCNQGGRKYMEDMFSVAYQQTSDDRDLEYAFFGIFDGHGGCEAAKFAKDHLMDIIVKQKNFWSDKDEDVLRAIRDGYIHTHYAMWRELDKWPRTASGLPSTAGTTASIAFIRKGKIYIGHVGDSGIVLGFQDDDGDPQWKARPLTRDHKPECVLEMRRIQASGGKVISKSGVPRVVWNRPRIGHKGPVRRSTHIDEIPFLAVARSLGDLWSYNSELDTFVVSPEPDVKVIKIDVKTHRCLIFGTDGLWNMLSPQTAVSSVQSAERHNEKHFIASQQTGNIFQTENQMWINPSKSLVDRALERWASTRLRADNTSVVTLMIDPPGPSRLEFLLNRSRDLAMNSPPNATSIPRILSSPSHSASSNIQNTRVEIHNPPDVACEARVNNDCESLEQPTNSSSTSNDTLLVDTNNSKRQNPMSSSDSDRTTYTLLIPTTKDRLVNTADEKSDTSTDSRFNNSESIQVDEVSSSDIETDDNTDDIPFIDDGHAISNEANDNPEACPIESQFSRDKLSKVEEPMEENDQSLFNQDEDIGLNQLVRQNAFTGLSDFNKGFPTKAMKTTSTIMDNLRKRQKNNSFPNTHENCATVRPETPRIIRRREIVLRPGITTRTREVHATKRRHSSTLDAADNVCHVVVHQEPCMKRRTRSEDRKGLARNENNPINQKQPKQLHSRLRWLKSCANIKNRNSPTSSYSAGVENIREKHVLSPTPSSAPSSSYQRRNLEKKATPIKTVRRPSINCGIGGNGNGGTNNSCGAGSCSGRLAHLRSNFTLKDWDQAKSSRKSVGPKDDHRIKLNCVVVSNGNTSNSSTPQRWLRSDTIAATPIKTLRSRNVDIAGHTIPPQIAHQYGIVKQNRLSLNAKLNKLSSSASKIISKASMSLTTNKLIKSTGINGTSASALALSNAVSVIAKRVKSSSYNPSARSRLATRSRLKRLSK